MRQWSSTAARLLLVGLACLVPWLVVPIRTSSAALDDQAGAGWGELLRRHVSGGGVDYSGLKADAAALDRVMRELAARDLSGASRDERLAFWLNAYNAAVLTLVVERYPDLESVREVPGFFDELRVSVAGERLTLDEVEQRALALHEPRAHFALVCAAESCPPLRSEPYRADDLEAQLDDQTRRFLADERRGARWDAPSRTLGLSALFKWYGKDFTGRSNLATLLHRRLLLDYVRPFLQPELGTATARPDVEVQFLDYDWRLNDRQR